MAAERAERHVRVRVASHVEPVGVGEHRLVAVGRRVQQEDPVPRGSACRRARVAGRGAVHVPHRRHPPEHLLDRRRQERPVVAHQRQLIGVAQHRIEPAGHDVAGGLVPADEDEHRLEDQVSVGERGRRSVACTTRLTRSSAGPAAAPLSTTARDVGDPLHHGLHHLGQHLGAAGGEQVAPVEEPVVVLLGEAHQLADHRHRQRRGHVGDDVADPRSHTSSSRRVTVRRRYGSWSCTRRTVNPADDPPPEACSTRPC